MQAVGYNHQLFYQSSRAHNQNNKLALIIKSSLYTNNINTSAREKEGAATKEKREEKRQQSKIDEKQN